MSEADRQPTRQPIKAAIVFVLSVVSIALGVLLLTLQEWWAGVAAILTGISAVAAAVQLNRAPN